MPDHRSYIRRCIDLARKGAQSVSPNPMVGAVLVHQDRIIGEGFHQVPGKAHAEVRAIESVRGSDRHLIRESTLYVSLEPCCYHGRTPPCTDVILSHGIQHVVVSCPDPNPRVSGSGIELLRSRGVNVTTGILSEPGTELIASFSRYIAGNRPYIIIKLVRSADGFIGLPTEQVWLSNTYESTLVHKLRSEVDAIMVGTNTAVIDDPMLTNRFGSGDNPLRVVLDRTLRIPSSHHLFDGTAPTIVFTEAANGGAKVNTAVNYQTVRFDDTLLEQVMEILLARQVQSLLVEGGAALIKSFLEKGIWDEAWIVNTRKVLGKGIPAPEVQGLTRQTYNIGGDTLTILKPDGA